MDRELKWIKSGWPISLNYRILPSPQKIIKRIEPGQASVKKPARQIIAPLRQFYMCTYAIAM